MNSSTIWWRWQKGSSRMINNSQMVTINRPLLYQETSPLANKSSHLELPPRFKVIEWTQRYDQSHCQLEIPIFSSGDLDGWLANLERYFQINGMDETKRLPLVLLFWRCNPWMVTVPRALLVISQLRRVVW